MPLYEFWCKKCTENFELLLRTSGQGNDKRCPECESTNVKRIFSSFSVKGAKNSSSCSSCVTNNCSNCN